MSRRLDIGIASYGNPGGLQRLLDSLHHRCRTDWRAVVIVNPHPDPAANAEVQAVLSNAGPRIWRVDREANIGYVGAVNKILELAETEYVAYCDHDVVQHTDGWDEMLCGLLDRHHELGMVFGGGGAYPIDRGTYTEILWGVGCCWVLPRRVIAEVGDFDPSIGHHEEVDYQTRVRLAGYRIAAHPQVAVEHAAKASSDPASHERISRGVVAWVNKWTRYFCGKQITYHSPNVMRHEDWPPSALYLEEYWKLHLPGLNANPEVVVVNGQAFDLIKVPRLKEFYRHRVI